MNTDNVLKTIELRPAPDYLAPDGSEIRLLTEMKGGGICHCTLPVGRTSTPVAHYNVEEIWYVVEGMGEIWRQKGELELTIPISAGTSLAIPPETHFQFRNTGKNPLHILIVTIPPWPGPQEAEKVDGIWSSV